MKDSQMFLIIAAMFTIAFIPRQGHQKDSTRVFWLKTTAFFLGLLGLTLAFVDWYAERGKP